MFRFSSQYLPVLHRTWWAVLAVPLMMAMMAVVLLPMIVAPQWRISAGTIHIVCVANVSRFLCTNPRRSKTEPVPELRPRVWTSAGKIKHFGFSHFTLSLHNKYFSLTLPETVAGGKIGADPVWSEGNLERWVLPALIQEGSNARRRYFLSVLYSALACVLPVFTLLVFFVWNVFIADCHEIVLSTKIYYIITLFVGSSFGWWLPQQVDRFPPYKHTPRACTTKTNPRAKSTGDCGKEMLHLDDAKLHVSGTLYSVANGHP